MDNPFRIVDTGAGPLQHGLHADRPMEVGGEDVYTLVSIEEGGDGGGTKTVLRLPVLWAPEPGAEVDLTAPPRSAQVVSQRYQISEAGVASLIVLSDPRSGWDDWAG